MKRAGLVFRALAGAGIVGMAMLTSPSAWPTAYPGLLAGVASAAPAVSYWSGLTTYPGQGPGAGYTLDFTKTGNQLTYFFVGGECKRVGYQLLEVDFNFPAHAPINNGTFDLNYTDHKRNPGFHMIMKGRFSSGTAKGTLQVLNDPQSGGVCTGVTASWRAHNDD